ncbi:MAG: hypothetical protein A2622_13255 [Bdellovibrionales bacterium RIFCSPHIGHO2_01_FULL_40_29]|nr:MAG: hypothetical protein A2622_13255 [Bdellovibrionales bacterium RIFCSPHIGHO2_01_FULL_40_29]OFZ33344.1 MAG: hypothetical protein A3D17_13630 [Bdellovibrionales bacterium RIFCSPHIGHO2_02_FULL_40_15]
MKKNIFFIAAMAIVTFSNDVQAQAQAKVKTLKTYAQDSALVKYNVADAAKPGICSEIIKKVESIDPDIKITGATEYAPLSRVEPMLESGQIDVFFCLLKSAERIKKYNYASIPLYTIKHVMAVRADDDVKISNYEDVRKLGKEGTVLVTFGSTLVKTAQAEKLTVDDSAKTDEQNFSKLLDKRARFFYGQDMTLLTAIKNAKLEGKVKIIEANFKEEPLYLATSKKLSEDIFNKLQADLEKLKKSGDLDKISAKYK